MFAMSGGTSEHSRIIVNILTDLNAQFEGRPCEVHGPELRVKVSQTGLYTYPDIVALCGEPRFEDDHFDTLLNPQLIIEVLSPSTESYVRGRKFAHYRAIDSLREYILVSQTECRVERFVRQDDNSWVYSENTDLNSSLELTSVACRLPLGRVYYRVDFERARSAEGARGGTGRV
jgi:Uma2 family endonuclease